MTQNKNVHLTLDLSSDNVDHMAALSDFAGALARDAQPVAAKTDEKTDEEKLDEMAGQLSGFLTLGRDRIREIIDTAMQDGAQGTPAEKTVKVLQSLVADVPGPGFGSENLTEATTKYFGDRRTVETAKANTRTRRTKAEVAADKAGKVGGFRNRETGESAEDYTEAIHDHVKSYTNSEIKKAKAEAEALHDHVKSYTNSEIEKARAEAEAIDWDELAANGHEDTDDKEITQETLTESVLAAVEPKGTPEGDDRRKKIRAFIAGRDHNTKNGAKASRIGELKTEDYRAVYDFAANLAK
jgi:hypothetical protein